MISALFFTWFSVALLWTINALRRPVPPGHGLAPLWLPGMIVSELAGVFFITRAAAAGIFLILGGADLTIGRIGFVLFILSELGLLVVIQRAAVSAREMGLRPTISGFFKLRDRKPSWETIEYGVPYSGELTLNAHRRSDVDSAPTLVYMHPGSWMRGRPGRQARPLIHRLVEDGWVVLDIRYPLSPLATFPDHLIGVKRAIAWAKSVGAGWGVDPDRIVVAGGSAGAHLAALVALTPNLTSLQPGFEGVDLSVIGCVPFYGIFDLFNRNNTRYDWPFVARYVMKATKAESPALYELGSPLDLVNPDAPPFHVLHGEYDSVVLAAESRHFVTALESAGNRVTYTEVKGAQHGFDGLNGLRARAVAGLCADWLNDLVAR
jgi:acetyl esterase/lipase